MAAKILQQDEVREKHLRAKNLRDKVQGNFFKVTGLVLKENLSRVSNAHR